MNKKNMAKLGVSLGLVSALGVGATLAMLSNKTDTLVNTFTASDKGIGITLDEKVYGGEGRTSTGNNYNDLVPGQTVVKDPTVYITENSLNCNVFVKVTNANGENLTHDTDNIGEGRAWLDVTDKVSNPGDGIKYYAYMGTNATGTVEQGDNYKVVATSSQKTTLTPVFNNVTVKDNNSEDGTGVKLELSNITVKAAAVQADSVTDEQALQKAVVLLNK